MFAFLLLSSLADMYGQGDLIVTNGSNRRVRFSITSVAVYGDCDVILYNNGFQTLNPNTFATLYVSYTNFTSSWLKQEYSTSTSSTITSSQADTAYGTPNWEHMKVEVLNNFNQVIYQFGLGTNNCLGNEQTFNNGTFSAVWEQIGNDIQVSFIGS